MPAHSHISRPVESVVETIDFGSDEKEILHSIERRLSAGDIPRVIVMPSTGIIHIFRTAYHYSEDQRHMPHALAKALVALGFFTGEGEVVPLELITPVDGADPQYMVELTLVPSRATLYHLIT